MTGRRVLYLLALLGGLVFYWAYREWLSWFFLLILLLLPWFSLLVSLPAILTCRAELVCPPVLSMGAQVQLRWQGRGYLPLPRFSGLMIAENRLSGRKQKLRSTENVPTSHCGLLTVTLRRPKCHDYLGLFRLPIGNWEPIGVLVRPAPVKPEQVPDLRRHRMNMWRPKPGGGFSENHDLRLYRPGDHLRQVHWKLSAKTGKLITREPLEAVRTPMLLTLSLDGTPNALDRKLGQLLWVSRYLVSHDLPHRIQCRTGAGMESFTVESDTDVTRAIDRLLQCAPGKEGGSFDSVSWCYHIGGDAHE